MCRVVRRKGRPKQTWEMQVKEEMKKNGLVNEDTSHVIERNGEAWSSR